MRRLLPVLVALVVLSVPSALAATRTVDITQAGFTPNRVTIDYGDTVDLDEQGPLEPPGPSRPGGLSDLTGPRR